MTSSRLPLLLALLTLLMGGVALYFFVRLNRATQELKLARQQVLARDRVIYRQEGARRRAEADAPGRATGADTVKVEPPAAAVFADELGTLTGEQLSDLMKAGLPEDPEAFLKQDLRKHQAELLPAGTMGGTTRVTDARILTRHYVLAAYEDGHTAGHAVLRYDVRGPGQVEWRKLDAGAE